MNGSISCCDLADALGWDSRGVLARRLCPEPSFLCEDLDPKACATCEDGTCLCLPPQEGATVELESFDPEDDTEAPVMKLLGTGILAQVIGSGTLVMLDYVNVDSQWTDPGVTVTDNVDTAADVRSFAL